MGFKVIPANYNSIQHLPGSGLTDVSDTYMIGSMVQRFIDSTSLNRKYTIIVTEKVDGCNVGVIRQGDSFYCVTKRGYLCSEHFQPFIRNFVDYVDANFRRFALLIPDGGRAVFEWVVKSHGLIYKLPHEPLLLLDLFLEAGQVIVRQPYQELVKRGESAGFMTPGLVHMGIPMQPKPLLNLLGGGFHGCASKPEALCIA